MVYIYNIHTFYIIVVKNEIGRGVSGHVWSCLGKSLGWCRNSWQATSTASIHLVDIGLINPNQFLKCISKSQEKHGRKISQVPEFDVFHHLKQSSV